MNGSFGRLIGLDVDVFRRMHQEEGRQVHVMLTPVDEEEVNGGMRDWLGCVVMVV